MKRGYEKKWFVLTSINFILALVGIFLLLEVIDIFFVGNENINGGTFLIFINFSVLTIMLFVIWGLMQFFAYVFNEGLFLFLNDKHILTFLAINHLFIMVLFIYNKDVFGCFQELNGFYKSYAFYISPIWFLLFYFLIQTPKNISFLKTIGFIIYPALTLWNITSNKLFYAITIVCYVVAIIILWLISKIGVKKHIASKKV